MVDKNEFTIISIGLGNARTQDNFFSILRKIHYGFVVPRHKAGRNVSINEAAYFLLDKKTLSDFFSEEVFQENRSLSKIFTGKFGAIALIVRGENVVEEVYAMVKRLKNNKRFSAAIKDMIQAASSTEEAIRQIALVDKLAVDVGVDANFDMKENPAPKEQEWGSELHYIEDEPPLGEKNSSVGAHNAGF